MSETTTLNEGVLLRFDEAQGSRSVVLEDDGRVAYAYLLGADAAVVGDVWLYNVGEAPSAVDWQDGSSMPFMNPAEYCESTQLPRLHADSSVNCTWTEQAVTIYVEGVRWARLETGSKPGWSILAGKAGPLAKPLAQS